MHKHEHDIEKNVSRKNIIFVLIFNIIITVSELVGGIISNSLALLSDSFHNFTDTIAIFLTYIGIFIASKEKNKRKTYGYKRAEIIISFLNSLFLIIVSLYLIYEGIKKIIYPEEIKTYLMLIIAVIGFLGNFFSVLLLKSNTHSLNVKSSYLHLLSDTLSSVGVILSGLIIMLFDIKIFDGLITVLISLYIIYEAFSIFKKSIDIFMQSSADIDYDDIKKRISYIQGVKGIHHIHSWLLDDNTIHFEAHLQMSDMKLSEAEALLREVEKILKDEYKIEHITLQQEVFVCEDLSCGE
ncbi:MAG TPA: cation diffusion facilitator family transporter [Spirochaetota bacterium]|nr:cation diffusion facilitator family transporter [Spirochaetota bacterium]HOM38806.1 cation diffusion facilitator family transporter [Spirochaetota bacterium]HPQ49864.1 cation diffusion facilitator family transporter [Spirochaetota bacterium]